MTKPKKTYQLPAAKTLPKFVMPSKIQARIDAADKQAEALENQIGKLNDKLDKAIELSGDLAHQADITWSKKRTAAELKRVKGAPKGTIYRHWHTTDYMMYRVVGLKQSFYTLDRAQDMARQFVPTKTKKPCDAFKADVKLLMKKYGIA